MKTFMKWIEKCGYDYVVTEDVVGKEFDFGNGLIVIKYERKNGGLVYKDGLQYSSGNNKQLIEMLEDFLKERK